MAKKRLGAISARMIDVLDESNLDVWLAARAKHLLRSTTHEKEHYVWRSWALELLLHDLIDRREQAARRQSSKYRR